MTKTESTLVGITMAVLPPFLLMVFFWWSTAAIAIYHILPMSEKAVTISAITGLGLGIILDIAYVRKWVHRFYFFNLKHVALVYLFSSAIATAFCMGLPVGNILLGIAAGFYVGRRSYYSDHDEELSPGLTTRAGVFTAIVTGLWALSIGLLVLNDPVVTLLTAVLMMLQYWCTTIASWMSLKLAHQQRS